VVCLRECPIYAAGLAIDSVLTELLAPELRTDDNTNLISGVKLMSRGKKITVYLPDGSPTGIRQCELGTWPGQVTICPRTRVTELRGMPLMQRPGAYILLEPASDSRGQAYIGEADNVQERLQQHARTKPSWERVIVFCRKDDNLTKAHVKYLEARFVELAAQANRFKLENNVAPRRPALPISDIDDIEDFIDTSTLLLSTLGIFIFQPLPGTSTSASPSPVEAGHGSHPSDAGPLAGIDLFMKEPMNGVDARGRYTDEGMVVFAGSVGVGGMAEYLSVGLKLAKKQMIQDGLVVEEGDQIRLVSNVVMTSPSAAAGILGGGARNGRIAWKDASGKTLKNLEDGLTGT